jgi:glycosyltransferase involved in cell wall biosynthesis
MKIAFICNLPGPISADGPGGTEVFVYNLIKSLNENKNYEINLFAANDSEFKEKLFPFFASYEILENKNLNPMLYNNKIIAYKLALFSNLINKIDKYDLIHNNIYETYLFFPFSNLIKKPVIHTVHNIFFTYKEFGLYAERFLPKKDIMVFVSSYAMKKSVGNYNKTFIYNGIDTKIFTFNEKNQNDNLISMSRATPKKGIKEALIVANKVNRFLNIIVKVSSPTEEEFLNENILKSVNNKNYSIFKNISLIKRVELLQNSKLFLFPIQWEEPFGLVMIESMACGTPVVAFARGSVPEVIKDGETGFIVNPSDDDIRGDFIIKKTGIEGLCEAVERIYSMPEDQYRKMRKACREHVEKNFTIERMIDEYEKKVYYQILKNYETS